MLERHYLSGENWDKVASNCYVSLRTVHNLSNNALRKLEPLYIKSMKHPDVG